MMIVKLLTLAAVAILSCEATFLQFPASGKGCVLIDTTTNNTLEWTASNGTKTYTPNFSFTDSNVIIGECGTSPSITVQWAVDQAQFSFAFKDVSNSVVITLTFTFIPDNVFKNGKMEKVTMTQTMSAGTVGYAYTCDDVNPIEFNQKVGADTYKMTFRIMKIKIQGFGVNKGIFSPDVKECDEKKTSITTKPTTKPTPTNKFTTKPTNATTKPTNATTKPTPTTKPTNATTKPTPTTKPTNATTKPTPTTKPTNATTKTTPTTKPTNATTKPTPTTQPTTKPTTPLPPADHPEYTFKVMDGKVNCIMFQAKMLFTVPYPAVNGNTTTNKTAMIGLQHPQNTTGKCNTTDNTNMLSVKFNENWVMEIAFATEGSKSMLAADDSSNFWWKNISLTYTYDKELFPDDLDKKVVGKARTVSGDLGKDNGYEASKSGSYICNSDTKKDVGAFSFETWNLQYNAFQTSANQSSFSTDHVSECSADVKTNSIVPIAVGAALAGLVVIVLIAYLIGRRRNRKGYESV